MKIPEPFFLVINPLMRFLLRSPFHAPMSNSLLLITFKGRKSGREFTTPVRYLRSGDSVRCYTSRDSQWWRNLRGSAEVTLRIAGEDHRYRATAIDDDPEAVRAALVEYFAAYPQDAAYHEVRLDRNRQPEPAGLQRASRHSVLVEATSLGAASDTSGVAAA